MTDTTHPVLLSIDDPSAVDQAVALLDGGQIVAIPTETVYGLAADATNGEAVARVFAAKGRPSFNPLICHVSSLAMAKSFADFDDLSLKLAERFWPGPLTLVLPLSRDHGIHPLVSAGLDTVAVRMPTGLSRHIIERLGRPLAAPSANRSGSISPTSADAVARSLGNAIPLILDGGPCAVGLESTIVKVEDGTVWLLRPGGVAADSIEDVTGGELKTVQSGSAVQAPGQLSSHYAPRAAMRLNAHAVHEGEALLAFGQDRAAGAGKALTVQNLSPDADLVEAAANLFAMMDVLDGSGALTIAVEPVPTGGLGDAINDRLSRAAAPRQTVPVNAVAS